MHGFDLTWRHLIQVMLRLFCHRPKGESAGKPYILAEAERVRFEFTRLLRTVRPSSQSTVT
jgi:hypothetical protein